MSRLNSLARSRPGVGANAKRLRERGESLESIVVRDAVAADIPALAELHVELWNRTYPTERGPTVATRIAQWTARFQNEPRLDFAVVLEDRDGRLIGFVSGEPDDGELAGQLTKIYLRWEYHGLGIGRRMMEEAARRFLERGIGSFLLYAEPTNPSIGFYDRMGGERLLDERGEFTGAYGWRDARTLICHDSIIDLYERHADAYDRDRGRSLEERAWLDRFLAWVRPGGTVLDVGCGVGEPIARYVIERGFGVVGVDASPSMVARCRARFPDSEWLVADMRELGLGRRFDGVLAWDSFFHLAMEDQRRMFPRFAAHAREGAPLMFTSGSEEGEAIGSWRDEPLYHASLARAEYEQLLAGNGFVEESYVEDDPDCGGHTVWLARFLPHPGPSEHQNQETAL